MPASIRPSGRDFNPRSPCGERHLRLDFNLVRPANFNPRSPCGERPPFLRCTLRCKAFQSTLSLRRATWAWYKSDVSKYISIHALLAESDACTRIFCGSHPNFNPRSPCGERRRFRPCRLGSPEISIHALLAESDRSAKIPGISGTDFNPRSPCGERHPA